METTMIFFFLSCIMILSPALMNLIKHWTQSDQLIHAIPFNRTDVETGRGIQIPCFYPGSFKTSDKIMFFNGHGCSFCEKWLPENKATYFYCDMRFCSDDCRTERMRVDNVKEKLVKENRASSPTRYTNATSILYLAWC